MCSRGILSSLASLSLCDSPRIRGSPSAGCMGPRSVDGCPEKGCRQGDRQRMLATEQNASDDHPNTGQELAGTSSWCFDNSYKIARHNSCVLMSTSSVACSNTYKPMRNPRRRLCVLTIGVALACASQDCVVANNASLFPFPMLQFVVNRRSW